MQWLISDHLRTSEGLDNIQAISLWGSKDLKRHTLSLKSRDEMRLFVSRIDNSDVISCNTEKNRNGSTTYTFTKSGPYGNGFQVVFYMNNSNSSVFTHFTISSP